MTRIVYGLYEQIINGIINEHLSKMEILSQSLDCFRGILKDLNFGAMMVGGERPESIDHLFVSIQSFNSQELIERTAPDFYDYIVVDEAVILGLN